VPEGDPADPTRDPQFYNPTFRYLADVGFKIEAKNTDIHFWLFSFFPIFGQVICALVQKKQLFAE
jgi:hypothetical protein